MNQLIFQKNDVCGTRGTVPEHWLLPLQDGTSSFVLLSWLYLPLDMEYWRSLCLLQYQILFLFPFIVFYFYLHVVCWLVVLF